jgi:hypothetical protein
MGPGLPTDHEKFKQAIPDAVNSPGPYIETVLPIDVFIVAHPGRAISFRDFRNNC